MAELYELNIMERLFSVPQVKHREMVSEIDHPTIGSLKLFAVLVKYSDTSVRITLPPPLLGEHTVEILRDVLGYDQKKIQKLKHQDVI